MVHSVQPTLCQAVIVLYKTIPQNSPTLRSLREIAGTHPDLVHSLSVLVYDNSPQSQNLTPEGISDPFTASLVYKHDPSNGGLAKAYGQALDLASRSELPWLLLLDQDTTLTADFLSVLLEAIQANPQPQVCAIVPKLIRDGMALSPLVLKHGQELSVATGIAPGPLTVLNSAACVRVSALMRIGGFPQEYPLDYLDHVVFHRLQRGGDRVQVLPISIEHQLSVRGPKGGPVELSLDRYKRMLAAEWGYVRETKPKGGSPVQRVRLILRALEQRKLPDKAFARQTLASAFSLGRPR